MSETRDIVWEVRRLAELRRAATPGPWRGCAHVNDTDRECPCHYRGDVVSETTDEVLLQLSFGPDRYPADDPDSWKMVKTTDLEQGYANGRFIAAAGSFDWQALADRLQTDDDYHAAKKAAS